MKIRHPLLAVLFCLFVVHSCKEDDNSQPLDAVYDASPYILNHYSIPSPHLPEDNPLTIQGVKLGRMLFYEPMLSKDQSQTCASCHNQSLAFSDSAKFSIGVEGLRGRRQAMALFNLAWHSSPFFWDGRARTLHDQALMPIEDPLEMNETLDNVVAKLSSKTEYRNQFIRAFGTEEITAPKVALALEQFMLTLISGQSKYDKYLAGMVEFSESEKRGLEIFERSFNASSPENPGANCGQCHTGINFENDAFMNNGLDTDENMTDLGKAVITGDPLDRGEFKVPSLRNIALTSPYMHDGRFETLEEVIDHYNEGLQPSKTLHPSLAPRVESGLQLDEQAKLDLVNFLETLSDEEFIQNKAFSNPF